MKRWPLGLILMLACPLGSAGQSTSSPETKAESENSSSSSECRDTTSETSEAGRLFERDWATAGAALYSVPRRGKPKGRYESGVRQ